jgi:hypothetical protein
MIKLDKRLKNKLILLAIGIYLVVITQITLFLLLNHVYLAIDMDGFILWEVFIGSLSILSLLAIWNSRKVRFFFSGILLCLSGLCFFALILIQSYTTIEFILSIILGIILIISTLVIVQSHNKELKKFTIFVILGIGGTLIFIFIFYQKPFFATLLGLIIIFPLSLTTFLYSMQTYHMRSSESRILPLNKYFKIALILFPLISGALLFSSVKTITIDPKNSPELIFWTDHYSIPDDEATLQLCAENDVGFAVVLRDSTRYLSDRAKRNIERLLNHSVITYIAIGGHHEEFYATIDNAEDFTDIFKRIRAWLLSNNLYYYENLKGFVIDAETSSDIILDIGNDDALKKSNYFIEHLPSQKKIHNAQKDLEEFIDLIHQDNKKIGIVKLPAFFDEFDDDHDFSHLSRNIYSLDLPWDFSVSMIYRNQHMPRFHDYIIEDMSQYDYTSDYELEYLDKTQLERNIIPLPRFYYEVVFELNSNELGIAPDHRYIFIGNFASKFKDTSYIKDKEYKKDLDICRHFSSSKVFLYKWKTFRKSYDNDELADLIRHNNDLHDEWTIKMYSLSLNREILITLSIAIIDRLFFIY